MNSFLLNFWIILRNCRNKCSCSFSVTSFFTCQVLNTNTDSTIVYSYFCKVQILKLILTLVESWKKIQNAGPSPGAFCGQNSRASIYICFCALDFSQKLRSVPDRLAVNRQMTPRNLSWKNVSWWHLTSFYVQFSTFNPDFSQTPVRNVLRSNVIKIETLYLDNLREEDVSDWHLAFRLGIKGRKSLMETGGPVAQVCNPSLEPRLVTICEWDESFHPAEGVEAVSVQV